MGVELIYGNSKADTPIKWSRIKKEQKTKKQIKNYLPIFSPRLKSHSRPEHVGDRRQSRSIASDCDRLFCPRDDAIFNRDKPVWLRPMQAPKQGIGKGGVLKNWWKKKVNLCVASCLSVTRRGEAHGQENGASNCRAGLVRRGGGLGSFQKPF